MWQHNSDTVCHFALITVRGRRWGKKRTSPLCWSWMCAALLMLNSQLDVPCIGCHCEKLSFLPLSGANLQAYVSLHTHTKTNTHKRIHNTHQCLKFNMRAKAAGLVLWFLWQICRTVSFQVSSHAAKRIKRFIIFFVITRDQPQTLRLRCNPKMNSTSPPTQLKGTKQRWREGKESMPTAHSGNHVSDFCKEGCRVGLEEVRIGGW